MPGHWEFSWCPSLVTGITDCCWNWGRINEKWEGNCKTITELKQKGVTAHRNLNHKGSNAKYSDFSETSLIMKSVKVSPCGHLDVCRIMYWHFFVGSPYMSALVGPIMPPIIQSKQTLTFITPSLSLKRAVFLAPRRGWLNIKNTTIGMFSGQRFQVAYMRTILKENWHKYFFYLFICLREIRVTI